MRALDHRELETQASVLADRHEDASVYCVDFVGAAFVPVPDEIARHFAWRVSARSPIELMAADFRTDGTDLFVECRRAGTATGVVRFADDPDTDAELHLLNRGDCVIGIVVPLTPAAESDAVADNADDDSVAGNLQSVAVAPQSTAPKNVAFAAAVNAPANAEPQVAAPLTSRMILHLDAAGVIRDADSGAVAGLGRSRDELVGLHLIDLMHADDAPWAGRTWVEMVSTVGGRRSFQGRYLRPDGGVVVVDQADTNALDGPHNVVVCEMIDVTEAVVAQSQARFQTALLDRATSHPEAASVFVNAQGHTDYRNPRWGDLTGLAGHPSIADFVARTTTPDEVDAALTRALRFGEGSDQRVRFADASGVGSEGVLEILALLGPTGERGALVSLHDVVPVVDAPPPAVVEPEPIPAAPLAAQPVGESASPTSITTDAVPGMAVASSAFASLDVSDAPSVPSLADAAPTIQPPSAPVLSDIAMDFPELDTQPLDTAPLDTPDLEVPTPNAPDIAAPGSGVPGTAVAEVDPPDAIVTAPDQPRVDPLDLPDIDVAPPEIATPEVSAAGAAIPGMVLDGTSADGSSAMVGHDSSTSPTLTPGAADTAAIAAPAASAPSAPVERPSSHAWNDFWNEGESTEVLPAQRPKPITVDDDFKQERSFTGADVQDAAPAHDDFIPEGRSRTRIWGALGALLVTALAAGVRLFRLDSVPGSGRSQLEAVTELETQSVSDSGALYSTVGLGQPTGPIHVRSWLSSILPDGLFGARLIPAIVGAATVLTLFVLVRRRFGDAAAVISGAILAVMVWHVHYSRLDLGVIWWPLAVGLFLLFVSPLLERNRPGAWWRWLAAGLFLGIGSYASNANWLVIATSVVAILIWVLIRSGSTRRTSLFGWVAMTAVSLLVALPMGRELLGDDQSAVDLFASNDARLREGLDWNSLSMLERVSEGLNWWGTTWARMSLSPIADSRDGLGVERPLNLIILALAAVGLVWVLVRARSGFSWLLIALTLVLPLGAAFTADFSLKHSLPLTLLFALFAGVGLSWMLATIRTGFGASGKIMAGAVALAFAGIIGFISLTGYFDVFANDSRTETLYNSAATDGIEAAADLGADTFVNYYSAVRSFNGPTRWITAPDMDGRDRSAEYSEEREFTIRAENDGPQAWVLFDDYLADGVLNRLEEAFPDGEVVAGGLDDDFLVYSAQ